MKDITHSVAGVASRDKNRAQQFINDYCGPDKNNAKAYGTYEELVADPVTVHS